MARTPVKEMDRDQQKAVFASINEEGGFRKDYSDFEQTERGKVQDRKITAKKTLPKTKENLEKWRKHPNQMDIEGIDTTIAKKQYKSRIEKKELKNRKYERSKINKQIRKKQEKIKKAKKPEEEQKIKKR